MFRVLSAISYLLQNEKRKSEHPLTVLIPEFLPGIEYLKEN